MEKAYNLESANLKMVKEVHFLDIYSNAVEEYTDSMPLDFSKTNKQCATVHQKDETSNVLLEHLQCTKPLSNDQMEIIKSPHYISPVHSTSMNNTNSYINSSSKTLMELLNFPQQLRSYKTSAKINHQEILTEQSKKIRHQESLFINKMIENQYYDSGVISPVIMAYTTAQEISTPSKNGSSTSQPEFNIPLFSPITIIPPQKIMNSFVTVQEPIAKTSNSGETNILQRILTAPLTRHHLDNHANTQQDAKGTEQTFKACNSFSNHFPTSLSVFSVGDIQCIDDKEYRYQQYMKNYYAERKLKINANKKSQDSINKQADFFHNKQKESPSISNYSPQLQTSNKRKIVKDLNSSAEVQTSCKKQAENISIQNHDNVHIKVVPLLPNDSKDAAYRERRRKNNAAAKRSRDTRRKKEALTARRAKFLESENRNLRFIIASLKQELDGIKGSGTQSHNRF